MRYDVDEGERRRKKVGEAVLMVGIWGTGQRWADPDSVARCFVRLPCVCGTFATSNGGRHVQVRSLRGSNRGTL